jgi:hypothetical protein
MWWKLLRIDCGQRTIDLIVEQSSKPSFLKTTKISNS